MLANDCLVQIMENIPTTSSNMIRKTVFDVTVNGNIYVDACCVLMDTAIIFKVKINEEFVHFKVRFQFDLLFEVHAETESKSDFKERNEKFMTIASPKNPKQFKVWQEYLEKTLNQKGFHQSFKAIKKIGKGNFATVYLMNKIQDNSKFAVKAFSKDLLYSEEKGKESLINEIEVMRRFNHKNLLRIYGVYQTDRSIYIVNELLEGGVLSDVISKKQKHSALEIKIIMKSILEGLEAMHKKNIMHRDLKPQNILFRRENCSQCVIADFGLAQSVLADEYLFARCGTPGFVAPEIVNLKDRNAKYTCACDLFSLGIIFHMLLLNKSPFPGKEYNEVLSQNRASSFNFDSYECKQLPEASLSLLQRLLEKDPIKRITANEALKHAFFYSEFTVWENNKKIIRFSKEDSSSELEVESPLMMTRSNERKKITHIRGDSCLKFKMKQNVMIGKINHEEEQGCIIDSPELGHKVVNSGFRVESRFKRMANGT